MRFAAFAVCLALLPAVVAAAPMETSQPLQEKTAQARTESYRFNDAFIRATPGDVTAAYIVIKNPTAQADTLVGASAPWAERIEMHVAASMKMPDDAHGGSNHDMVGHTMTGMKPVHQIALPAKGELAFRPGGMHFMIYDVKDKLRTRQKKTITLNFKNAGSVQVPFTVHPMSYQGKSR